MRSSSSFSPYKFRQELSSELRKVPKRNKQKLMLDILTLIRYAQEDSYENLDI